LGIRKLAQVNDATVAPLGGILDAANNTDSHRLPAVVDADGLAKRGARQAYQFDNAAAAPLGGAADEIYFAESHSLPGIVDAGGFGKC
jgi:hypothetical protein